MARTDYAANCGNQNRDEIDAGPSTLDASWSTADPSLYHQFNGIFFRRSKIHFSDISRGTSNVLMIGERYLNIDNYTTGNDPSDNENMYVGFDNDIYRDTYYDPNNLDTYRPRQDARGIQNTFIFGSPHNAGFNVAYCDGHVESIAFDIDPLVLFKMGDRNTD
jgi:prepilin-type processing-associated H-X9-DG protein